MTERFDLVVIGTGTAASGVAWRCRKEGWSVAVVDNRPYGGTCALRGCDPKKVLRRGAEIVEAAQLLDGKGVRASVSVDWPALMAFKRRFTDPVPEARMKAFAEAGIATFEGTACFVGDRELAIDGRRVEAQKIVIATGAEPVPLDIPGSQHLTASDAFLDLDRLPRRIVFVGGGYVSFELAHIAIHANAGVVVLDSGPRPLKTFDADLVSMLVDRTRRMGIDFRTEAQVASIDATKDGLRVSAAINGVEETFDADIVVHGAGRRPAVEPLDLEKANVKADRGGIEVNRYLQSTTDPAVYAAGDAAGTDGPPLTPVASLEAETVAENLLHGNRAEPDYTGVPSTVFTIPPLARVGLTEDEAKPRRYDFATTASDMRSWYAVRRVGETHAAAKVLVDRKSGSIVGAHILGPDAGELINIFALAIRSGLTTQDLKGFVSVYPSAASDIAHLMRGSAPALRRRSAGA